MENKKNIGLDAEELALAEEEALETEFVYIHKFKKTFEYEGKSYEELVFDWGSLTGRDGLAIEHELQQIGKPVIVPTFSGEYLIRMAARACEAPMGADAFENMRLSDYNKIRSMARSFLLQSEL